MNTPLDHGANAQVGRKFTLTGLTQRIGLGHFFPTVDEAVARCDAHRTEKAL